MVNNLLVGFKPLKPGKIHLLCPKCGRKQSNMDRADYDSANAVLLEVGCPKCDNGDFEQLSYYDSKGNEVAQS